MQPLLSVRGLHTRFATRAGEIRAVDGVSFDLGEGAGLGIVGESGSGKSVTALSIMGLVPSPPGRIAAGRILLGEEDLLALPERRLRQIRGRDIAMVFQEPASSLNPVFTVGYQIEEAIRLHQDVPGPELRARAVEALELVGISAPGERIHAYPHQLSGGMCQRVMIAMALCCRPRLLVADEPTTALDVTTQAQVLDLIKSLRARLGMSLLLITHNLAIVADMVEHVVVMYAGRVIERAPSRALLDAPRHPYTAGLLGSLPRLGHRPERLYTIEGAIPSPHEMPSGCRFRPRCPRASTRCETEPPLEALPKGDRAVACWHPLEVRAECAR